MNSIKTTLWWGAGVLAVAALVALGWYVLSGGPPASDAPIDTFGAAEGRTAVSADDDSGATTQDGAGGTPSTEQAVFKIADGPVAGATFVRILHPTTTIARYVMAHNGHVFDLPLDKAGSVPRSVSNTTIPGIARVLWEGRVHPPEQGVGAVLQYLSNTTVKSVVLALPAATTSSEQRPVRLQFLPDNLADIAASPDGSGLAYLLRTLSGVDGYTARADGTAPKKVFSLPLSRTLISWPSQNTLLAQSASAAGAPGVVFSIPVSSGAAVPLVFAPGLTAIADPPFSTVVYHTAASAGAAGTTYVHNIKTGTDIPLSFDPVPELCIWSITATSTMYCATALSGTGENYVDLLHAGVAGAPDSIIAFNISTGKTTIIATPGGSDGGVRANIAELAIASDDSYLLYVTRGDRSLWGVRLK